MVSLVVVAFVVVLVVGGKLGFGVDVVALIGVVVSGCFVFGAGLVTLFSSPLPVSMRINIY